MSDINTICISGRLGEDPAVKYFETGSIKTTLSIGVNRYNAKKQAEEVTWHKAVAWGKKAEFVAEVAKSGALVYIQGSLQKDTYKDEQGNNRASVYILIEEVKVNNKRNKDGDA